MGFCEKIEIKKDGELILEIDLSHYFEMETNTINAVIFNCIKEVKDEKIRNEILEHRLFYVFCYGKPLFNVSSCEIQDSYTYDIFFQGNPIRLNQDTESILEFKKDISGTLKQTIK